jgi:hypothetical protein
MEVVEYRGTIRTKPQGTECGYRGFGKIAPELLVAKGAIDNCPRKPAERVAGRSLRLTTGRKLG